jgi:hypothetical protein
MDVDRLGLSIPRDMRHLEQRVPDSFIERTVLSGLLEARRAKKLGRQDRHFIVETVGTLRLLGCAGNYLP